MAFWIWKTSTKVSHCSMSKERISCVNDCICSALFGFVVGDTSTSAIWLSSDTPDLFTGPRTINNTMLSALFLSTSRLEVTYVKQAIDCHPNTVPLCLPERRSKEVNQTDVLPSLDLLWSRTRRERYFPPNEKTRLDELWRERNRSVDLEKDRREIRVLNDTLDSPWFAAYASSKHRWMRMISFDVCSPLMDIFLIWTDLVIISRGHWRVPKAYFDNLGVFWNVNDVFGST